MEPKPSKTTRPLSKEETKGLLSLIEESKIINNKKLNAHSNKMKVLEWRRITEIFNLSIGTCRRTPQQLRLKWENLKKNSRRRSILIRMERTKTGGEPPGYIPPDVILDRVAAILGSTGEGLTERNGGNAEPQIIADGEGLGSTGEGLTERNGRNAEPQIIGDGEGNVNRKLLKPDNGCQAKNNAIAEYYKAKKKMIESKNESIKLQNEYIKLQKENIKLRNKKLTLEIRKLMGDDDD